MSSSSAPSEEARRDPAALSAAAAASALERGSFSARELLEAVIARVERTEPLLHAYLRLDTQAARAAAQAADQRIARGERLGPLDGIPFAVKDNLYTAGMATSAASRVPQHYDPALNAALITRLQQGGAILLGKLNTWEFGTGDGSASFDLDTPPARNPWHPAHYTGGSSSGSAAAVAAGSATFSIGTDTGGSVRLPAAACGVVGFKPTFGRISRYGMIPNCASFDTAGPMTLSVEDAALVYAATAGYDQRDPDSLQTPVTPVLADLERGVAGLRIGRVRNLGTPGPQAPIAAALERAAEALREAGARIVDVTLPLAPADYRACSAPINRAESFAAHEAAYRQHRALMGQALRSKLDAGDELRASVYLAALGERRRLVAATDALFSEVDVLLLPINYRVAPRLADSAAVKDFTLGSGASVFSLTGHPALALPLGFDAQGLPLSVQLAAGFCHEPLLLRTARALEKRLNPLPRRAAPELIEHLG